MSHVAVAVALDPDAVNAAGPSRQTLATELSILEKLTVPMGAVVPLVAATVAVSVTLPPWATLEWST